MNTALDYVGTLPVSLGWSLATLAVGVLLLGLRFQSRGRK